MTQALTIALGTTLKNILEGMVIITPMLSAAVYPFLLGIAFMITMEYFVY